MAGRKTTKPGRIEAPRIGETLVPHGAGAAEDGDIIEAALWADDEPTLPRDLQVAGSRLHRLRLTGQEIEDLTFLDTVVDGCELSGTVVSGWRCERVELRDCRMAGLVATDFHARHVRFVNCQLHEAWFRAGSFDQCELLDCDLTGADLSRTRIVASRLWRCRLDGVDFTEAETDQVALHGSSLTGTKGLGSLRNLTIGSDQVVDLAIPLLASRGVRVDDDPEP